MISKPIKDLTEADLQKLIESQVPESKTLEYKKQLPDSADGGKVKFLRSLTAFANTNGGDVLFGMEADGGVPIQLVPLQISSTDQLLLWMESLAATAVEPRLTGVQYQFVQLATGGNVLVIRVSRSWASPHRVVVGGHAHFYGRNSAGSYQLDVAELRRAFVFSESVSERIRSFRVSRLLALGANETPVPLVSGAKVILHVVPFSSFWTQEKIAVVPEDDNLRRISPPGSNKWSRKLNLDGRLSYDEVQPGSSRAYAQLYRNGVIEALFVVEQYKEGGRELQGWYEEWVVEALRSYMKAIESIGLTAPFYVFLSMVDIASYRLTMPYRLFQGNGADRNVFAFPEVEIDSIQLDPANFMKPIFDGVWNAFGYERSMNYDHDGVWLPSI